MAVYCSTVLAVFTLIDVKIWLAFDAADMPIIIDNAFNTVLLAFFAYGGFLLQVVSLIAGDALILLGTCQTSLDTRHTHVIFEEVLWYALDAGFWGSLVFFTVSTILNAALDTCFVLIPEADGAIGARVFCVTPETIFWAFYTLPTIINDKITQSTYNTLVRLSNTLHAFDIAFKASIIGKIVSIVTGITIIDATSNASNFTPVAKWVFWKADIVPEITLVAHWTLSLCFAHHTTRDLTCDAFFCILIVKVTIFAVWTVC